MQPGKPTIVYTEISDIMLAHKINSLDLATTDTTIPYTIWRPGQSSAAEFLYVVGRKPFACLDDENQPRIEAAEVVRNSMFTAAAPALRKYAVIPYYSPEPSKITLAGLPAEIKKKIYELCIDPRTIVAKVVMTKRISLSKISIKCPTALFKLSNSLKFEFYGAQRPTLAKVSKYEEFFLKEMIYKPLFKIHDSDKVHYFHPRFDRLQLDFSVYDIHINNSPNLSGDLQMKRDLSCIRCISMEAILFLQNRGWILENIELLSSLDVIELRNVDYTDEVCYPICSIFRFLYEIPTPGTAGFFPDILMPAPFGFQALMTVSNKDECLIVDDPTACEKDAKLLNNLLDILSEICLLKHFPRTVLLESKLYPSCW
ncbi:hypothetical protein B7463_g5054, partial [Scytalidium lignicola]